MQSELSFKVHAEILKLISSPKTDEWGKVEKKYREEIAEKILKICMENKLIFITGTSVLPTAENDNVVSFSTWDRGSVEVEKNEMRIYRYALRLGVNTTKKGVLFRDGSICFNPHGLEFPENYAKAGWVTKLN
jgi:hypothetical protein